MTTGSASINRLGRIASTDYRDHSYLAKTLLAPRPRGVRLKRHFVPSPAWDQGNTPQCVAYSSLLYLNAGPIRNKGVGEPENAQVYYDAYQEVDGITMPHEGTTVRAAMQILKARGFISEYRWAFDVGTVTDWILTRGPMVFGTDWLESMFEPITYHGSSYINFEETSGIAGGHAWLGFGVDLDRKCFDSSKGALEMQNSWGPSWANKGRAWLPLTALEALLAEDGEAACAVELLKK
jgi:hypothetical protein